MVPELLTNKTQNETILCYSNNITCYFMYYTVKAVRNIRQNSHKLDFFIISFYLNEHYKKAP